MISLRKSLSGIRFRALPEECINVFAKEQREIQKNFNKALPVFGEGLE
jgi:hypothetical protein